MDDLISRQAAIDVFSNNGSFFVYGADVCKAIVSRIKQLPAAEPERKTGRWVGNPETCEFMTCSACGCEFDWVSEGGYPSNEWAYCPECGAFIGGELDE